MRNRKEEMNRRDLFGVESEEITFANIVFALMIISAFVVASVIYVKFF